MYLEASWHVPEISALRRWKQMDPDVKTSLRSQKTSQNTCYRENGGREGEGKREEKETQPLPTILCWETEVLLYQCLH